MGKFPARRKIFRLQFEDPELKELEVRVKSVSMGKLLDVADQAQGLKDGGGLGIARELFALFVTRVVSWNLQHELEYEEQSDDEFDGDSHEPQFEDTPITVSGLLGHDPDLVLDIVLCWFDAMVSISAPLDKSSTSGPQYPEGSIPMGALSSDPLS
jgi:hypothetical protein